MSAGLVDVVPQQALCCRCRMRMHTCTHGCLRVPRHIREFTHAQMHEKWWADARLAREVGSSGVPAGPTLVGRCTTLRNSLGRCTTLRGRGKVHHSRGCQMGPLWSSVLRNPMGPLWSSGPYGPTLVLGPATPNGPPLWPSVLRAHSGPQGPLWSSVLQHPKPYTPNRPTGVLFSEMPNGPPLVVGPARRLGQELRFR